MPALINGYAYDIFISYRQKDNRHDGWVSQFVKSLQHELDVTFKEDVSIYFDINPHDGLLETHDVGDSLKGKLKCLVFIPIISQTYCDPKCFAWEHEFLPFKKLAAEDGHGLKVNLSGGNVANRILPVRIHELDSDDRQLLETVLGGVMRSVDFIYKSSGVNRPLTVKDDEVRIAGQILYRDQVNKVANSIKEIIAGIRNGGVKPTRAQNRERAANGEKRFSSNSSTGPDAKLAKWIALGIFAGLVIFLVGYFQFFNSRAPVEIAGTDKSIAVIPFTNMTGDKEQEFISDGVTEEILNHLSKISSMKVISRQSSMKYKDSKLSMPEIAAVLGVANILEGSVRRSGDKVRITAQLIDGKTDKHIWSEDYDYRDLKDIFAMQTDVSMQIASKLKAKLTGLEKGGLSKTSTANIQAYKYYLKGRHYWDKRSKESYDSAEANYKRAIDLDPEYALAYSGLADCYTYNQKNIAQVEAIPIARAYAAKALTLDNTLSEAMTTLAFIQSHFDYDWEGSKKVFERVIRDNPNYPIAHLYYGNVLLFTGNNAQGLEETKKALQLDPLSSVVNMVLGRNYYYAKEYDLAIQQLQKTLTLNPNFKSAYITLGLARLKRKLYPQAISAFSKLPSGLFDFSNGTLYLSYGYAIAGRAEEAKKTLEKVSQKDRDLAPYNMALVDISRGDFKSALTDLTTAFNSHAIQMMVLSVDPALDPIRGEPEFKALMKKMNFAQPR
jgi:TolB-like protein/Tfp pilus assembly protein PilF